MSSSFKLTKEEKETKNKIERNIKYIQDLHKKSEHDFTKVKENAKLCLELHRSLKRRGVPPIHSKHMIENRRVSTSDSLEFYEHLHPQEDLIKFTKDTTANTKNSNKKDVTLGKEFKFLVYSKRWGHKDCYTIKRNIGGWHISFVSTQGQCDHGGDPYLFENLRHDSIGYPNTLESYMYSVWSRADNGATYKEVQEMLNKIAEWVSLCEESTPEGILV